MVNYRLKRYGSYEVVNLVEDVTNMSSTPEEDQAVSITPLKDSPEEKITSPPPQVNNTNVTNTKAKWKKIALKGMLASSKESKQVPVHSETRTSQLRAKSIALKGARDGSEERIRNMEQKKEIESLKKHVEDLKEKLAVVQKQAKQQGEVLDGIKKTKRYREDGAEYIIIDKKLEERRQENVLKLQNQLDEILLHKENLSEECGKLTSTNEKLSRNVEKAKMDLKIAETTITSLENQASVSEGHLKQTSDELQRRIEEVQNLSKMYEEKIQGKEKERLEIEKENKEMIESLKRKCDVSFDLENKLKSSEKFAEEQTIALNDLIKMVSDLEVEKTQLEEETENLKAELGSSLKSVEELQNETNRITSELEMQSEDLKSKSKIIEENHSALERKDLQMKKLREEIDDLKLRNANYQSDLQRLSNEKNAMEDSHESKMADIKEDMEKLKSSLEEELNMKNQQIEKMENLQSEQKTEIVDLKQQIDELECELQGRHSELENHSQNLERYREQLAKLEAERAESAQQHEAITAELQEKLDSEKQSSKDLELKLKTASNDFISDKEKMITEFEAQLKRSDDEIAKNRVQLKSKDCTIETLTADKNGLQLNLEILETKLQHQLEENEDLEKKHTGEIATMRDLLDIANIDCNEKEVRFNEKIEQYRKDIASCKKQSEEIAQTCSNTEKTLRAEIQNLKDALKTTNEEKDSVESNLEISLKECQQNLAKLEDVQKNYTQINDINSKQETKILDMENELAALKNKMAASKKSELNLQKENAELNLKITSLENKMILQNSKMNDLITNNEMQSKIQKEAAEKKTADHNASLKELNEKLAKTSEEIMRLELENRDLKSHLQFKQSKETLDREQTISKLEHENINLRNDVIHHKKQMVAWRSGLEKAEAENRSLKEKLEGVRHEDKTIITNLKLENKKFLQDIQHCQKDHKEQLSIFKNTYDSKYEQLRCILNEKEREIYDLQENLTKTNAAMLAKEKELRQFKSKLDEEKCTSREKERIQEERESFFCNEINRMQNECRNKILELETDKEKTILDVERKYGGHFSNLKDEYEKNILGELRSLQSEYFDRLNSATIERDELIKTLQNLESLNLQQKIHHQKLARELRESNQNKTRQLHQYQLKCEAQQRVIKSVTKYLEEGEVELTRAKEIVELMKKLENDVPGKFEMVKTTSHDEFLLDEFPSPRSSVDPLNITWPQGSYGNQMASTFRRNSHEIPVRSTVEQTKSAICFKMKSLENLKSSKTDIDLRTFPINRIGLSDHVSSSEQAEHSSTSSEIVDASNESSPITKRFPNIPIQWQTVTSHLGDSGFTEHSFRSDYARSQLSEINKEFLKLDLECVKIEREDPVGNEKWLLEVKRWKEDMQEHLLLLMKDQKFDKDEADGLRNEFPKCILFHPSQAEVNAIISKVNRQYNILKQSF